MLRKLLLTILLLVFSFNCYASDCCGASRDTSPTAGQNTEVDRILNKLNAESEKINTLDAKISYLYVQDPELLDSRITRTGKINYQKDKKSSKLLIRFDTFQQDDEKKVKRLEEYFFDGVWLKVVDHKNKTVNSYQKALKTKPVDAFELISRDFPMLGFSSKEDLRKDFEISMPKDDKDTPKGQIRFKMTVKKGSPYAKNYSSVDFRIDNKTFLPSRIITTSNEGDIYDISFEDLKINKKLKDSVFMLETPSNFSENKHPIKKQ